VAGCVPLATSRSCLGTDLEVDDADVVALRPDHPRGVARLRQVRLSGSGGSRSWAKVSTPLLPEPVGDPALDHIAPVETLG
jgi:hypothetical protein